MTDVFESKSKVYKVNLAAKIKRKDAASHGHTGDHQTEKAPVLPLPVLQPDDVDQYHQFGRESPNPAKLKLLSQLQVESLNAQVDRLRVLLREKEIEMHGLKSENSMLRQRERRNQKDLETLEHETMEAPLLIRRLKEELSLSRAKVKGYYGQIGDDSRVIRQMHEERTKMKDQISKLEELVEQKKLADRDTLSTNLKEAHGKISELQKLLVEAEKKLEMVDRNLNSDNKYLRGKISGMEKERELIGDQIKALEESVKEKEKMVASLSIYRYNAIHRQKEATCKICAKREKDELETKRKTELIENMPSFEIRGLKAVSGTAIKFQLSQLEFIQPEKGALSATETPKSVTFPASRQQTPGSADIQKNTIERSKQPEAGPQHQAQQHKTGPFYTQLRLVYSTDPTFTQNVQRKKLDTVGYQKNNDLVFNVDALIPGSVYYFSITPGHQDTFAPPPPPISLLVDIAPNPPTDVSTFVLYDPPTIQIRFKPPKEQKGSAITRFRVYQSNTPDFKDSYRAIDSSYENVDKLYDSVSLTLEKPYTAVPYFFKVVSVNAWGESEESESSDETIIDYVPEQPEKPTVKRIAAKSIHVSSLAPHGAGMYPSTFKIIIKATKDVGPTPQITETVITVPAKITASGKREAHHTITDVEAGVSHQFSVIAINSMGESVPSEWSEDTDIDFLVPALQEVHVNILSATSFTVVAPVYKEVKQPVIIGYKVKWASNSEMTENVRSSNLLACDQKPYHIDGLASGEIVYIHAYYVGEQEEGMPSSSVFVPLATHIPLPSSPVPLSASQEQLTSQDAPPPGDLKTGLSGSSRFSVNERQQLHFGYAGYHEPPPNPNRSSKLRQSTLRRSNTNIDTGRKSTIRKPAPLSKGPSKASTSSMRSTTRLSGAGSLSHLSK